MEEQEEMDMADRMTVHKDGKPIYEIVMDRNFEGLSGEIEKLGAAGRKICLVTDSNVAPLYMEEVRRRLEGCGCHVTEFIFPAGEEQKNLDTVQKLYEHLILNHYERRDLLAALGGGVVGDLAGFAAATYLRGVDFIQIPTTLLSQVDSSIGGKTGVDFDAYKNMVGAFHMPRLVYTNLATLLTLPEEQFSSGMGEVVKHGLIRDRGYYQWLKEHQKEISDRNLEICQTMVLGSNRIKGEVVEKDPTEKGDRALLNFGHTLGHAIEKRKHFTMYHGHCVGLGAIAAAEISARRGLISEEEAQDVRRTMELFKIPVSAAGLSVQEVIAATKLDKKMEAGVVKFILLKQIGQAFVDRTVTDQEMEAGLKTILEEAKEQE